jgi:hypothetical protein
MMVDNGWTMLDVEEMKASEMARGTEVGKLLRHAKRNRHDLVVEMLKKAIYNGQNSNNAFLSHN